MNYYRGKISLQVVNFKEYSAFSSIGRFVCKREP